jgi:hypothetical protein
VAKANKCLDYVCVCQLPASWPSEGSVVFKDYKLRYREGLDLALKGISLRCALVEPSLSSPRSWG